MIFRSLLIFQFLEIYFLKRFSENFLLKMLRFSDAALPNFWACFFTKRQLTLISCPQDKNVLGTFFFSMHCSFQNILSILRYILIFDPFWVLGGNWLGLSYSLEKNLYLFLYHQFQNMHVVMILYNIKDIVRK